MHANSLMAPTEITMRAHALVSVFWWAMSINTSLPCSGHSANHIAAAGWTANRSFLLHFIYIYPAATGEVERGPLGVGAETEVTERERYESNRQVTFLAWVQGKAECWFTFLHVYLYLVSTCETYQCSVVILCCFVWFHPKQTVFGVITHLLVCLLSCFECLCALTSKQP